MATINAKGQKQLQEEEMLPLIQSYLTSSLFKQSMQYESIVQTHAPYIDFVYAKVPLQTNLPTPQEKYVFASLFKDVQAKTILNLHLARILQHENTLLCLTIDHEATLNEQKYFILAIVFPYKQQAELWRKEYSMLTLINVAQPFRSTHKISLHTNTTMLITRPENIKIQAKFRINNNADRYRGNGNCKFKDKNYLLALYDYEVGIGLSQNPESKRQRAILYANSSQCLFQMRLYQSALIYADISASIDKKYAKGIYRKFACCLQLKLYKQVPTVLRSIHQVCTPSQFQKAQNMFYRSTMHNHGIYQWKDIFTGSSLHFGQYTSPSLRSIKEDAQTFGLIDPTPNYYIAQRDIAQYQMIMFSKPLVYCRSEKEKFGQNYEVLINQIMNYCDLQDSFFQRFQQLPNQCEFQGHVLKFNKYNQGALQINQIHAKCLRCLELEKVLGTGLGQKEFVGIWEQLYKFKHECLSNCTYIHVKGGLAVFAVRAIKQGETLTIDFLNWETTRRDPLMLQKLGISCDCNFCKWEWDTDFDSRSGQILYAFYKHQSAEWIQSGHEKLSLFYLWNLIFIKHFRQVQLMKEYLSILQRYPLWQCIINCLKYLRVRPRNDVFDYIKSMIKKFIEKYFKMPHSDAVEILKNIL